MEFYLMMFRSLSPKLQRRCASLNIKHCFVITEVKHYAIVNEKTVVDSVIMWKVGWW